MSGVPGPGARRPGAVPRVVASDCDGTLLRSDGTVSPRTRAALQAVTAAGATVVLVTARPPRWVDELRDVAGEHGIVLCGNGAFTYDVAAGAMVSHRLIEARVVAELLLDLQREVPGIRIATEGLRGFAREPDFDRASGRRDGEWLVGDLHELGAHDAGKILVRHETWGSDEIHRLVSAVVGGRAEVSHSGSPGLAEIAAVGVTKGVALAAWCEEQGVQARDVWAFGDMPNDLPMLTWAGRSFAVANAHDDVLAAATEVTASNDDDGVALALERAVAAGA